MKRAVILVFTLLLAISSLMAEEAIIKVERDFTIPSFIGYVDGQVIVVLKEEAVTSLNSKATSGNVFEGTPAFDAIAQKFEVQIVRPQFGTLKKHSMASSTSERKLSQYFKVEFNPAKGTLDEIIEAYEALPMVDHVEKDAIHSLFSAANDTYYKDSPNPDFNYDQWHYYATYSVNAENAWDIESGDASVVVGVLDSGVKYWHSELGGTNPPGPADNNTNGNIWVNPGETPGDGIDNDGNGYIDDVIGYDFFESGYGGVSCVDNDCDTKDNDPADWNGHGTHVSGTIAAITNNNKLVAGVAGGFSDGTTSGAGNGVKIIPCRIGYEGRYRGQVGGFVMMSAAAEAMYYLGDLKAAGINVAAINCSWGSSNSGGLGAAADYLISQDVMIIVAAGNSNSSAADYLGIRADCMDVGATDASGDPASFSNYGSWVDIAAPGVDILSTYFVNTDPTPDYISLSDGTSMSCPHVVGVAALLESYDPSLSAADKWNLMMNNTTSYNMSKNVGVGIVNAWAALNAIAPNNNPPTAAFSGNPTSGTYPLNVSFTDASSNSPTSWAWTFGDGGNSTSQNPSYTYTAAGTYTVTLTATNAFGSDGETKNNYITVTAPNTDPPVADFSGSPTSGDAPLNSSFTDASTNNPTSWSWTFGDGGTSNSQNPSYTYTSAGTFTVSLTATNVYGNDTNTKTAYVTVTEATVDVMHVHSIVVTRQQKGKRYNGRGEITIYNQNEQPVANANVTVTATGPTGGTATAATDGNGIVVFTTSKVRNPSGEWCFEVTAATHASNTYDSGSNHETKVCESGVVFSDGSGEFTTGLPNEFGLNQNYPNPFNPATEISFSLATSGVVSLEVFNITGQKVATLADGHFEAGQHFITWDASSKPSGIYLYRLITDGFTETKKMVLMK